MKNYILTVAVTALLSIPTINFAADAPAGGPAGDKPAGDHKRGPGGPGGERHFGTPEERLAKMTEHLGLTQAQQDAIKAIYAKNADAMKAFRDKGRENLTEEDKTKMHELMKSQMEEIANVLTPEQKDKMKKAREEHAGAPGGPGGEGHRRGGKPGEGDKPEAAK